MVEAKESKKPSLKLFVEDGDGVKIHQMLHLHTAHRAGAIALIAWMHGDLVAVVDPDVVGAASADRKSIAWEDVPKRFLMPADERLFDRYLPINVTA